MKNIRNNLLNYKRFIFPSFKFHRFKDPINVPGGEIKWKFFHGVHEKDAVLGAKFWESSKPNNKGTTPIKLKTKHFDSTSNIS